MNRTSTLLTAVLTTAVVGVTLSGCSSTNSGSSGGGGSSNGKIGVILPDTKSSVRWEIQGPPGPREAAFKEAGVEYDIQNAEGRQTRWPPSPTR